MKHNEDDEELNNFFNEFMNNDESCPVLPAIFAAMSENKPFGMRWTDELIEKFLEKRGYVLLQGKNDQIDSEFKVAVKKEETKIPDLQFPNLRSVFELELQKLILNILIKFGDD